MDQPLDEALAEVGLGENIGRAIRGDDSRLSRAFSLAVACERGDWARHESIARGLGLDLTQVTQRYTEALFWADQTWKEGDAAAA